MEEQRRSGPAVYATCTCTRGRLVRSPGNTLRRGVSESVDFSPARLSPFRIEAPGAIGGGREIHNFMKNLIQDASMGK